MKIYVVRHGQSTHNANPGTDHTPDPPLTALAHEPAEMTANALRDANLGAVALYSSPRTGLEYVSVTRDGTPGKNDASYLMAYFPQQGTITLKTERLAGKTIRGWWFNPRDGSVQSLGEVAKEKRREFSAPTKSTTEDWILVLDDAARNYPPPGGVFTQPRTRK